MELYLKATHPATNVAPLSSGEFAFSKSFDLNLYYTHLGLLFNFFWNYKKHFACKAIGKWTRDEVNKWNYIYSCSLVKWARHEANNFIVAQGIALGIIW